MVRIVDRFGGSGSQGKVVELHPNATSDADVRKLLREWMEKGDRIEAQETTTWTDGRSCTPYLVITEGNGEPLDIFAQLVTAPDAK